MNRHKKIPHKKIPPRQVREPIQVYLDRAERGRLDRLARDLGLSRAEVLRRGLESLERHEAKSFYEAFEPLIGAFDNPDAPTDLSVNHDEYLAQDLEQEWHRPPEPSS